MRVLAQQREILVREFAYLFRQTTMVIPKFGRGEMVHRGVHRPASKSASARRGDLLMPVVLCAETTTCFTPGLEPKPPATSFERSSVKSSSSCRSRKATSSDPPSYSTNTATSKSASPTPRWLRRPVVAAAERLGCSPVSLVTSAVERHDCKRMGSAGRRSRLHLSRWAISLHHESDVQRSGPQSILA